MRYLLHQGQLDELAARRDYLYDVFHMYFLPGNPEGSYIPLIPVGAKGPDVLFVTGHTFQVKAYLEAAIEQIPEKIIVITSCFGAVFRQYAKKKTIYVPNPHNTLCMLRNGAPYGFGFEISDAELNLYNANGDIMDRVRSVYSRL